jgi:hypothetical protein
VKGLLTCPERLCEATLLCRLDFAANFDSELNQFRQSVRLDFHAPFLKRSSRDEVKVDFDLLS